MLLSHNGLKSKKTVRSKLAQLLVHIFFRNLKVRVSQKEKRIELKSSVHSASKFEIVGSAGGFRKISRKKYFETCNGLCPKSDVFNVTNVQAYKYGWTGPLIYLCILRKGPSIYDVIALQYCTICCCAKLKIIFLYSDVSIADIVLK